MNRKIEGTTPPKPPAPARLRATQDQIDAARELYQDDNLQIDINAKVSEAYDGYWVQAWVWVACP